MNRLFMILLFSLLNALPIYSMEGEENGVDYIMVPVTDGVF